MKILQMTVIFFLTIELIAGCVYAPNYPDNWPKPVAPNSDIEELIIGEFNCTGKVMSGYSDNIEGHLPVFLGMDDVETKEGCDTIRFLPIKGGLKTIAIRDGKSIATKSFLSGDDYVKKNGWLDFRSEGEGTNRGGVLGYATGHNSLTINTSSDLIIKSSGFGLGVVLLIPVAAGGHNWIMFHRHSNKANSADAKSRAAD